MRGKQLTRRDALRAGGGAVLAGLTAGLAGCSGILGGDDGEFTEWLPAPGEMTARRSEESVVTEGGGDGGVDHYRAGVTDVQAFEDSDSLKLPNIEGGFSGYVTRAASEPGLAFDDIEGMITGARGVRFRIFTGSFDAEGVVDELDGKGYSEDSERGGFTIHSAEGEEPDRGTVAGVSDDAVILSERLPIDVATDWVETIIDAKAGEADRYAEANEDFDLLTRRSAPTSIVPS